MSTIARYVVHAVRDLSRAPGFVLAVVLTLGVGIGVNTAVFSVVSALLIRPLPYRNAARLVAVTYPARDTTRFGRQVPIPALNVWRDRSRTIDEFASYAVSEQTLYTWYREQLRVQTAAVSPNFFSTLGVTPVIRGRGILPRDALPGAHQVALVSHAFCVGQFGGREDTVGTYFRLNGREFEVVGVLAQSFTFPDLPEPEVLVPLTESPGDPVVRFVNVIGTLRMDTSEALAHAELVALNGAAHPNYPPEMFTILAAGAAPQVITLRRRIVGDLQRYLLIASGAVLCVLLLACINVASLFLVRSASRERELAIRAALGANPLSLTRWIWLEMGVLAASGAAVGVTVLWYSMAALQRLLANVTPYARSVELDLRALLFTAGATALTILASAAVPAWRSRTPQLTTGLNFTFPAPSGRHWVVPCVGTW